MASQVVVGRLAGGARPAFSEQPPVTADLLVWLDPRVAAYRSVSGSDVDSLTSLVGTDVAANTSTNRPTYSADGLNGRPGVLCASASTQYLTDATSAVSALSDNGVFSVAMALLPTSVTSKQFINFKNNSPNNYIQIGANAGGNLRFARGAGGATVNDIAGGAISNNTPHVIFITYNGTNVSAWVDGALSINNVAAAADVNAISGLVYGSGWFGVVPSQPMDGYMGPLLVYGAVLSTTDRLNVQAWLGSGPSGYGVAA